MTFVSSNGITLHVQRTGQPSGTTLVFINSLGSDYRIWDDMIPDLADHYDVVRYDLRGHGLSDCPDAPYSIRDHSADLAGLLDTLHIERCVLIGISVGGQIAMDYTCQHPDKVQALVVSDTFPKIGESDMWNRRIKLLRQYGMKHLANAILERWFAPSYPEKNPIAHRGYYNMLNRMPVTGYTGTCEALRDADLTETVKTIQQKTLILCGADDQSTPPELVSELYDLIPNSRYIAIENAGHLPCVENPAAMCSVIQTFLKDVLS